MVSVSPPISHLKYINQHEMTKYHVAAQPQPQPHPPRYSVCMTHVRSNQRARLDTITTTTNYIAFTLFHLSNKAPSVYLKDIFSHSLWFVDGKKLTPWSLLLSPPAPIYFNVTAPRAIAASRYMSGLGFWLGWEGFLHLHQRRSARITCTLLCLVFIPFSLVVVYPNRTCSNLPVHT